MIEGKILFYYDDLSDVYEIRRKVFQVEQNVPKEIEFDDLDKEAAHILVFSGENPVATGRLVRKNGGFYIGRIAVLKEERGNKYGDFVVRMLLDKAFRSGAKEVNVGAQVKVMDFYKKIGFVQSGEEYEEANIKHIPMKIKQSNLCANCTKM